MVTVVLGEGRFDVGYGVSENDLPALVFTEIENEVQTAVEFKTREVLDDVESRLASHHFASMFSFGHAVQVMFMSQESVAGLHAAVVTLQEATNSGSGVSFPVTEAEFTEVASETNASEDESRVDDSLNQEVVDKIEDDFNASVFGGNRG